MTGDTSSASGRIVAVVTDLMLESRIIEKARAMGYAVVTATTVQALRDVLRSDAPDILVLDLRAEGAPWQEVVAAANGAVPIIAFGQHTKPDLLRAARAGGCALAVPRSQLVEEFPALIERARTRR